MKCAKNNHEWVGIDKGTRFLERTQGLRSILAKISKKKANKKKMITVLNIMALQHCIATEQGSDLYET